MFKKCSVLVVAFAVLVSPVFAQQVTEELVPGNVYLLANADDLDALDPISKDLQGEVFLFSITLFDIDLDKETSTMKINEVAKLPLPTRPLILMSLGPTTVNLRDWQAVVLVEMQRFVQEINGIRYVFRGDNFLTVYCRVIDASGRSSFQLVSYRKEIK